MKPAKFTTDAPIRPRSDAVQESIQKYLKTHGVTDVANYARRLVAEALNRRMLDIPADELKDVNVLAHQMEVVNGSFEREVLVNDFANPDREDREWMVHLVLDHHYCVIAGFLARCADAGEEIGRSAETWKIKQTAEIPSSVEITDQLLEAEGEFLGAGA